MFSSPPSLRLVPLKTWVAVGLLLLLPARALAAKADTTATPNLLAAPQQPLAQQAQAEDTLTRAELAQVLVGWFTLPRLPYSVFAVYLDVPLTHPDYIAIDSVRRQHLLLPDDTGNFYPEAVATQRDAWLALAKLLFPMTHLAEADVAHLLAPLTGVTGMPRYERIRVARLVSAKLLGQPPNTHLNADAPLSLAWMNETLATLKTNRTLIRDQEKQPAENANPSIPIPANVVLNLTPSQAISGDTINLGSQYYFQLLAPVQLPDGSTIPKDSSSRGTVVAKNNNLHDFTLQFESLTSAQTGQRYLLWAQTVVRLLPSSKFSVLSTQPEKENKSLLITGTQLDVLTQRMPDPTNIIPPEAPSASPPKTPLPTK